jgi:hypothetical protein
MSIHDVENPPAAGADGLISKAYPAKECAENIPTNAGASQAVCLEMLRQSVADDIERHIAQLDAALAMLRAGSNAGFLHGIRCGQAYWNAIKTADRQPEAFRFRQPPQHGPDFRRLRWFPG